MSLCVSVFSWAAMSAFTLDLQVILLSLSPMFNSGCFCLRFGIWGREQRAGGKKLQHMWIWFSGFPSLDPTLSLHMWEGFNHSRLHLSNQTSINISLCEAGFELYNKGRAVQSAQWHKS